MPPVVQMTGDKTNKNIEVAWRQGNEKFLNEVRIYRFLFIFAVIVQWHVLDYVVSPPCDVEFSMYIRVVTFIISFIIGFNYLCSIWRQGCQADRRGRKDCQGQVSSDCCQAND